MLFKKPEVKYKEDNNKEKDTSEDFHDNGALKNTC